jgi:outer membrane receptor for Fe3+-dicitrate
LTELAALAGASLVDINRGRVKPWHVFGLSVGVDLYKRERTRLGAQFDIQNITDRPFAYNFGNPFSGTHFGYPRLWSGGIRFELQ